MREGLIKRTLSFRLVESSSFKGLENMAEIDSLDIKQLLEDIINELPPMELQQQSIALIEKMVAQGIPEKQALQFVFEAQAKH